MRYECAILNQVDDQFTRSLTAHRAEQSVPEPAMAMFQARVKQTQLLSQLL